jgi:hypothetical protein
MLTRVVLIGAVLVGCSKPEPPPAQHAQAAAPAAQRSPPAPEPERMPSSAPKDRPAHASSQAEMEAMERAIAPYREQARRSYPDAKRRYLAGLPPGHRLAVVTELRSPGRFEAVFISVTQIEGDRITGRIANDILTVAGYKEGDLFTLSETDLIDWVILRPDGSEEGNVVGKFLDTWQGPQRP